MRVGKSRTKPRTLQEMPPPNQRSERYKYYSSFSKGLNFNSPLSEQGAGTAYILENFYPTSTGIKARAGLQERIHASNNINYLIRYESSITNEIFFSSNGGLYKFSDSDIDGTLISSPIFTGQTSDDYSHQEIANSGGNFISLVNGTDYMRIYNGTTWQQVTDVSTPHAVTGVDTRNLNFVWSYNKRLFFIQKGTMKAWYGGVNSISGALSELPLYGIFKKGGSLLFGSSYSSDSGDGLDDRCVFVTDKGEVAIYSGGDPSSISTWSLVGVYDIGKPLGKYAHTKVGGDLVVLTDLGLIALSVAIQKDKSQLKLSSLTYPVEPLLRSQIIRSGTDYSWKIKKYDKESKLFIIPPISSGYNYILVCNTEINSWCKYTGWNINNMVISDNLLLSSSGPKIYKTEKGGTDDGQPFLCKLCGSFGDNDSRGAIKFACLLKETWKYSGNFLSKSSVLSDYNYKFSPAPNSIGEISYDDGKWDVSSWNTTSWDEVDGSYSIRESTRAVAGSGDTLSPAIQVTSFQTQPLTIELISLELTYVQGGYVV